MKLPIPTSNFHLTIAIDDVKMFTWMGRDHNEWPYGAFLVCLAGKSWFAGNICSSEVNRITMT